jgi:hypothetical protein
MMRLLIPIALLALSYYAGYHQWGITELKEILENFDLLNK